MYYSLSRLSRLDIKWADLFDANSPNFFGQHHNPYYELIVIADGVVHLQTAGTPMTLHAGESLMLMPWETHTGWNSDKRQGQFFWVQFSSDPALGEFGLDRASELNIVHAERTELRTAEIHHEDLLVLPRQFRTSQRYKLLGLFEELVETMKQPKGYFRFHASLLLGEILRLMAGDFLEQSHLDTSFPASYITFRNLVNYLNNFYESDISKETLERLLDRKYEYLCQVFKKYAGTNIHHYVHQLRSQRAKYLLHNTEKSVKAIAEELGYQDPFYFSRMFKKIEGIAPQQYRNNITIQ
ncbi:AraC family transcriptional regulator [Paenibacillus sedimenti]|uniref:Helix-turn-helix transcriptional regulator n=1 Tax=Paenibacillus sedimenti TaxID=2770274 RepID=A0A926KN51_9BACL|nr:AraC family transcriptional regulator [Paenibacillus sedimenti]MBD0380899.1 helix-turn-helix transcriptional regulator [Paenibacillus sedimenti]